MQILCIIKKKKTKFQKIFNPFSQSASSFTAQDYDIFKVIKQACFDILHLTRLNHRQNPV